MILEEDLVWKIEGIKTKNIISTSGNTLYNAVAQTHWKVSYTDEHGCKVEFQGATPLDISEMTDDEFITIEQLTEELVISWIKSEVDNIDHVIERLEYDLEQESHTNMEFSDLPWSS